MAARVSHQIVYDSATFPPTLIFITPCRILVAYCTLVNLCTNYRYGVN